MRIGILAAGITPDELLPAYGSYADMLMALLSSVSTAFEFRVFEVREGQFPDSVEDCDGWLISGSKFNVDDALPWMLRLKQLILDIQESGRPLVGICFGHQIIADALGGKVVHWPQGWGVGLHRYQWLGEHPLLALPKGQIVLNAMHQDQVAEKPEGAEVIAQSAFCPNAGLLYGDGILTLQAHPEFSSDFEAQLIGLRQGTVIPGERSEPALAELRAGQVTPDSLLIGQVIARFFLRTPGESLA